MKQMFNRIYTKAMHVSVSIHFKIWTATRFPCDNQAFFVLVAIK